MHGWGYLRDSNEYRQDTETDDEPQSEPENTPPRNTTKQRLIYAETSVREHGNADARTFFLTNNIARSIGTAKRADWHNTKYMGDSISAKNPMDNKVRANRSQKSTTHCYQINNSYISHFEET